MAAFAGTLELIFSTVFGNKRVNLFKAHITNYNATGIPLTPALAGLSNVEAVVPFVIGGLANANAPLQASWNGSTVVYLYKAVNSPVADDTNLDTLTIHPYLLVIGT